MKNRGLGRGLDSLIPSSIDKQFDPTAKHDDHVSRTQNVLISDIKPNPEQPRRHISEQELLGLSTSIKSHGVLQPIVLAESSTGYVIIAGERRYRAAQLAGLKSIPAIVRSLDNQARLEVALIENIQRQDLTPLELATALTKLNQQFNQSFEELAKRLGKGKSTLTNTVRLLDLPSPAKLALASSKISEGHARQILALDKPKKQQELLDNIVRHGWSVRRAEQFVTDYKQGMNENVVSRGALRETEDTKSVSQALKTKVYLQPMARGRGRIVITYKDQKDQLRILKKLAP